MEELKILQYGVFDSNENHKNQKISAPRTVESFEFDFILSCSNTAISYIDKKSAKLVPNMLILRKPGQTSNSKLHFKCYCLHLLVPKQHPLYSDLFCLPEYFTLINDKAYHNLFEELMQHLIKQPVLTVDYFVLSKIYDLIYRFKKDAPQNAIVTHRNIKKENLSIRKAVDYMKSNFSANITLKDLGDLTGYSPNHFQHIFRAIVNKTPQKYLENIRVNHAKYLLLKNELSLTDVAYECGFSSYPHFTKVFKAHTLLTPYEFQQKSKFHYPTNNE